MQHEIGMVVALHKGGRDIAVGDAQDCFWTVPGATASVTCRRGSPEPSGRSAILVEQEPGFEFDPVAPGKPVQP